MSDNTIRGAFTAENIIAQLKAGEFEAYYDGNHFPTISKGFDDFVAFAGLNYDLETVETITAFNDWFKNVSYADKKQLFEALGFKVVALFGNYLKFDQYQKEQRFDKQFLDNGLNFFAFRVEAYDGYSDKEVVFGLTYEDDQALSDLIIDRDALTVERQKAAEFSAMFQEMMSHKSVTDYDNPFA